MKVSIVQIEGLRREPVDLSGALSLEIDLDNGDRFGISLSSEEYLDIHSIGRRMVLQIEPRATNAVHIRTRD